MLFFSTLIASAVLVVVAVPLLRRLAFCLSLVDLPGERKVHQQPVPRVGGLAMALGTFLPVLFWEHENPFAVAYLAGAAVLVVFGLLDDRYDLPPRWKLLGQLAAACIAIFGGGVMITGLGQLAPADFLLPPGIAIPLTILAIVGVTNAINLSDGLDGLAGGISLLILCLIGYLAWLQQAYHVAVIAVAVAGATYGFLRYNTYPATVFMGDVGSQLLGFSAITLVLELTQGETALNRMLPLVILGFPVLDTVTVMARRIAVGRSPFSADKRHFHHALLDLGLHQRASVLTIYLIQVVLTGFAYTFRFHSEQLLLLAYLAFAAAVLLTFSCAGRGGKRLRSPGQLLGLQRRVEVLRGAPILMGYLFPLLETGLFALLLFSTALCPKGPWHATVAALVFLAALPVISHLWPRLGEDLCRAALYLLIPLVVYKSALRIEELGSGLGVACYRLCFAALGCLDILVALSTRRGHGFHSTPLDFLILLIALKAAALSDVSGFPLVLVAAKIMICYFSCEVVLAERRGDLRLVKGGTLALLALVAWQGIR